MGHVFSLQAIATCEQQGHEFAWVQTWHDVGFDECRRCGLTSTMSTATAIVPGSTVDNSSGGVEQQVARRAHNPEVAGSIHAPASSLRRAPLRKHEVDAGATCTWRSCPRPTGRTISKQPCDWRGLSAAGEQGGATATAAPATSPQIGRAHV